MEKIKELEVKKDLKANIYILDKRLDKNKGTIGIAKFDNTKV